MTDRFNDEIKKGLSLISRFDFEEAYKGLKKLGKECGKCIPQAKDSKRSFIKESVVAILIWLPLFLYLGLCFTCFVFLFIGPIVALGALLLFCWF